MDSVMSFLGLINKAGRLAIGEEPVGAACRARKASLIITASDAAANSVRRASHFAQAGGGIPLLSVPLEKGQLGQALGRSSCAMAAVSDIGFAAALVKKLAATDPAPYTDALATLEQKAEKAMQRQKEKRAHEKKLLRGKKKPKA